MVFFVCEKCVERRPQPPDHPSKVIAEYDNGAAYTSPSREYIYSGGTMIAKIESSATSYFQNDHLSNRIVTDSSGSVVEQRGHYPFGDNWYDTGSEKHKFTTYERDAESGNDFAMARYNISHMGRFSSPDPHTGSTINPQSLNHYTYSANDPINATDPTGMDVADWGVGGCDPVQVIDPSCEVAKGIMLAWESGGGSFGGFYDCYDGVSCEDDEEDSSDGGGTSNPIARAKQVAANILQSDKDCGDFFGSAFAGGSEDAATAAGDAAESLAATPIAAENGAQPQWTEVGDLVGWSHDDARVLNPQLGATIFINTNGAFFVFGVQPPDPLRYGPDYGILHEGGYVGGSLGAQVLMILHEFAHDLGIINQNDSANDPDGQSVSMQNTQTILAHCKTAIDNASH